MKRDERRPPRGRAANAVSGWQAKSQYDTGPRQEAAAYEARVRERGWRVHAIAASTTQVLVYQDLVEHGLPTGETIAPGRWGMPGWLAGWRIDWPEESEALTPAVLRAVAAEMVALAAVMDASS